MVNESIQGRLVRKTALDSALYFPTIVVQGLAGLATASILSKLFGPDQYGNYVLAFGIHQLLSAIVGLWLHYSIVRLLPEYKAKGRFQDLALTLIVSEIVILFSSFVGAALLLALARPHIGTQLTHLLMGVLLGFPVLVSFQDIGYYYYGHGARTGRIVDAISPLSLPTLLSAKLKRSAVSISFPSRGLFGSTSRERRDENT
jgi:O-antigen/teichoic acid export membrane protein